MPSQLDYILNHHRVTINDIGHAIEVPLEKRSR